MHRFLKVPVLTLAICTATVQAQQSPPATEASCSYAVRLAGLCDLYAGIYGALSSVDYAAFGEVGPAVAKEVMTISNAVYLAKSVWNFKPDVDQIRTEYLVPMLKAIGELKNLKRMNPNPRAAYLAQSKVTYANLVIRTIDTSLKTQKIMPNMVVGVGNVGLGAVLGYVGMNSAADFILAAQQPPWFKEIIAPIVREFGAASVDLLVNGSKTPMDLRIGRIMAMEEQIRGAIQRICRQSPSHAQNECLSALNQ